MKICKIKHSNKILIDLQCLIANGNHNKGLRIYDRLVVWDKLLIIIKLNYLNEKIILFLFLFKRLICFFHVCQCTNSICNISSCP